MVSQTQSPERAPHKWVALGVLAAALALIVLDGTIVAIALPKIISELNLSLADAQWVNSLYSVVFAALLLGVGRL
ncbi:MAG: MFS transporter, partial [Propionibacteriaceae bacterium]